jgi:hypothetical protein
MIRYLGYLVRHAAYRISSESGGALSGSYYLLGGSRESTLTVCGFSEEDYLLSVGGCQEYSRVLV